MTKQFPKTEFTNWMDGFKILQSVTNNLRQMREGQTKSYAQWVSWNSTGYACSDVQKLLDEVRDCYRKETTLEEYIMLLPAFKKWMGSTGECAGVYVLTEDRFNCPRSNLENKINGVKVFATLQALIDHQEKRWPTKVIPEAPKVTETITIKRCQLEALVKKIVVEELNARSNNQRNLWNMDQFLGGTES